MKLIDADKVFDWMRINGYSAIYREMKSEHDAGTFDPTPPVQPDTHLKLYKCPNCKDTNVANAWNTATAANYGAMEITRIDETGCMDALFVCPSCGTEEDYGRLEVITDEQR